MVKKILLIAALSIPVASYAAATAVDEDITVQVKKKATKKTKK